MSIFQRERRAALFLTAALIGSITGACLYDPDQRCGPLMSFSEAAQVCVCDGNAIAVAGGCQRCADDEVASGGKCACPDGSTKNADNLCVMVTGLGDACDTVTAPCNDATYSRCAVRDSGTAGTCTKSCASNNDCDAAYTCATWEADPYCRTFEGFGDSCAGPADCTGDAKYCDSFVSHRCLVNDCSLTANDCPRGTMCCDFSGYGIGNLCVEACQ
jgi:hypothetical protein